MHISIIRRQLTDLVDREDSAIDLVAAALLIAQEEYPDRDLRPYVKYFGWVAEQVRRKLPTDAAPMAIVDAINHELFVVEGFRGDDDNYYDPRNSFLNAVLERKLGIPITLSLVHMEVCRRLGLVVHGIGLPGHFIVEVQSDERLLIDPFHRGEGLSEADCVARVRHLYGGRVSFHRSMLHPLTHRQILTRMLNNLKNIYARAGDYTRTLAVVDRLILLNPEDGSEYRDRGALYRQAGFFAQALADFRKYLALTPTASEAETVRGAIAAMERERVWTN
jgi:regulator of sirC expression with transglutaminase-like and TPR domain